MRETESTLQQFGEFLLKRELVRQSAAPYFMGWVRLFLAREAPDEAVADHVGNV